MAVRSRANVMQGMLALGALGVGLSLSLTACSSDGTVGPAAAGGSSPLAVKSSTPVADSSTSTSAAPAPTSTDSAAPATSSATSSPSQDPSALASSLKTLNQLWTDQGCKTALSGFSDYLYAQERGPAQGIAAIPTAVPKIRAGAQQTKKPQAADAMNKLAADLLTMYTQAQEGHSPDKGPVRSDWQHMGDFCSQQQP
jgi:hypothetical protein